ncbi:MAG: SWIM zinc finger family protein [Kurthia sp.]
MNINIAEVARTEEESIRDFMNTLGRQLDSSDPKIDETVRRAAFLVRQNYVKIKTYNTRTDTTVFTVRDASMANVNLTFNTISLSCSCGNHDFCRHTLAAIFSLYQYIDSLSTWLEQFRSNAQAKQLSLLTEDRTPETWLNFVQGIYKRNLYTQTNLNPYLLDSIFSDMIDQIYSQMPLEREWKPIYLVFMQVSLLSHTWKHFSQSKTEAAQSFYHNFIEDELEQLEDMLRDAKSNSRLFALDPFYNTLKDVAHYFLLNQHGFVENRIELYLLLWNHLFTSTKDREQELARLQTAHSYSDDLSIEQIKAIFLVMLDKTDELEAQMESMKVDDVLSWIELARTAGLNNQEAVRKQIIERIIPLLPEFINESLAPHFRMSFIKRFDEERQGVELSEAQEETLFAAYGKYGLQPFSNFLIRKKRYEEWAALHQLYPTSLAFLEICGLKTILEEKPASLLPLYHSLVQVEIMQKTRQNYKTAVRLMKKMKSAAKKSGKNEFWNDYVATVRKNYKRMRALQEEIEKGNLML